MSAEPHARRGRRRVTSDADIGAAVLAVGLPDVTYARVAEQLGVSQATLFRYADTREDLLRAGIAEGIRSFTPPPLTGPWEEVLGSWAEASAELWRSMPGSADAIGRGIVPASLVRYSGRLSAALVAAGFGPDNAVLAVDMVFDVVVEHQRSVDALDRSGEVGTGSNRAALKESWSAALNGAQDPGVDTTSPEAAVPSAVETAALSAISASPRKMLDRKLRVVIAGVRSELAPHVGDGP